MKKIFHKSKFYIGICLLIQCVSFVILFFTQMKKRKGLATAFLAVAAISGVVGVRLVRAGAKEEEEKNEMLDVLREDFFEVDDEDDDEDIVFDTEDDEISIVE
ncbi:MAG: hypothetical protein IJD35_01950 [Clostridia bacterium]|nr:hypothetical protein [Clostridia bacterium]